jgi:hypothetical protein
LAMKPWEGSAGRVCPCGRRCVERALAAGHRFWAQSCRRGPSVPARTSAYHEVVSCHAQLSQEATRPSSTAPASTPPPPPTRYRVVATDPVSGERNFVKCRIEDAARTKARELEQFIALAGRGHHRASLAP